MIFDYIFHLWNPSGKPRTATFSKQQPGAKHTAEKGATSDPDDRAAPLKSRENGKRQRQEGAHRRPLEAEARKCTRHSALTGRCGTAQMQKRLRTRFCTNSKDVMKSFPPPFLPFSPFLFSGFFPLKDSRATKGSDAEKPQKKPIEDTTESFLCHSAFQNSAKRR